MSQPFKIYGCGEDALSLWAFKEKCDLITGSNGFEHRERIIFYRPSFGRGGSNATFGEFDGIVIERGRVILIESKWRDKTVETTEIKVDQVQIERHGILSWYIRHWQGEEKWDDFREKWAVAFFKETDHIIPRSDSKLSKILRTILDQIISTAGKNCDIENVLLVFHPKKSIQPRVINSKGFKVIPLEYSPMNESGFIALLP